MRVSARHVLRRIGGQQVNLYHRLHLDDAGRNQDRRKRTRPPASTLSHMPAITTRKGLGANHVPKEPVKSGDTDDILAVREAIPKARVLAILGPK